jgi:hypothetical protein
VSRGINIDKEKVRFTDFHPTNKRGPLGHALMTACHETLHPMFPMIRKDIEKLSTGIRVKLMDLSDILEETELPVSKDYPVRESLTLRRLSSVKDKEGKLRVIGIFDYWTQAALKP